MEQKSNVDEYYLGKMDVLCSHCNAKHFTAEKVFNKGNSFNDCCGHGTVKLEAIPDFPDNLRSYCFKIQGQIYYHINEALYPSKNDYPKYGQLFIVDPQEAIGYRIAANAGTDREIMYSLEEQMIRQYNLFAKSYVMMKEEIEHQRELLGSDTEPELQLIFRLKPGYDRHRYHLQRTNEIAAVFVTTADGDIPESYVTIRNNATRVLQSVISMDPNVEPMVYPLFYPHGSQGWHKNIAKISNRTFVVDNDDPQGEQSNLRVTRSSYVKYRIGIRSDTLMHFCYIVDYFNNGLLRVTLK